MLVLPLDDVHSAGLLRIIGRLPVRFDDLTQAQTFAAVQTL